MDGTEQKDERGGVSVRALEIFVAALIMALATLVMYDSWLIGARWGADGPQSGYFPFYIGVLMFASSAIVFVRALVVRVVRRRFVEPQQFRSVLMLLVPSIVYVAVTAYIGIYVASALYLTYFMRLLGRYRWIVVLPIAIGVPVAMFFVFEIWFLVPLPKGPLEDWLGY